jgi:endonuclease V
LFVAILLYSFFKDNTVDAVASLVVLEIPTLAVVYEDYQIVQLTQPYISGFLAFREVDHLVALINQLRTNHPEFEPDVILVDGNGILHPRGFGIASHLGVLVQIPSIGVAKNLLAFDGMDPGRIKQQAQDDRDNKKNQSHNNSGNNDQEEDALDYTLLIGDSGQVWGAALVLPNQAKSIFVSIGHCVSLETAIQIVRSCQTVRIPEPIRQADLRSRAYVRQIRKQQQHQAAAVITAADPQETATRTTLSARD